MFSDTIIFEGDDNKTTCNKLFLVELEKLVLKILQNAWIQHQENLNMPIKLKNIEQFK